MLIVFTNLWYSSNAQIFNTDVNSNEAIKLKFHFDRIETSAKSTIFNVLKIENTSNNNISGKLNFSAPKNWNLFGDNMLEINVPANDSLSIPIRVAVSKDVMGEVGYSIVATFVYGNKIKSAYNFVTIPRKSDFSSNPVSRIEYLSNKSNYVDIKYLISNKGNIDELIHLEINPGKNMSVNGSNRYAPHVVEYSIRPNTDSIVSFRVKKEEQVEQQKFSKIEIKASNSDTTYNQAIWLKMLNNYYNLDIPEDNKCAILELSARNIFSSSKSIYAGLLKGALLLKNNNTIYYYLRNYNLNQLVKENKYVNSRYYVGYRNKQLHVRLGTIERNLEQNMYGTGVDANFRFKRYAIEGIYINDFYRNNTSYGGDLLLKIPKINLNFGAVSSYKKDNTFSANLGYFGASLNFLKTSSISFRIGASQSKQNLAPYILGYGFNFLYRLNLKKFKVNINSQYGDPTYTGVFGGRFSINGALKYVINKQTSIEGHYLKQEFNKNLLGTSIIINPLINNFDDYRLYYSGYFNDYVNYQSGLELKAEKSNQFYNLNSPDIFKSLNSRAFVMAQIKGGYNDVIVSPKVDFGIVNVEGAEQNIPSDRKTFYTANFNINIYKEGYGLYGMFRYGPYTIYEHYYYYRDGYFAKWFYLMPYYNKYFFNRTFNLDLKANYIYNISNNESGLTLNTQFNWFLKKDLSFYFLNSMSFRSRIDKATSKKYNYNSTYFEIGMRKEFNCKQPRVQYYKLKVIFFRDLNGDRIKNYNEPGINNVYVNLSTDASANQKTNNEFIEAELLSNHLGEIEYNNIPNGSYSLKHRLLGKITGNFSLEELERKINIDKDETIYIPYLENNKIFGKIILNRDPLSSLGPLSVSNIRVVAEDTKGHIYSALTDKQGKFTLYTPKTDYYVVKVNNVYYESFDVQQPEFVVKFNGYKQFEVTFVFNEKKKQINFDNELDVEDLKLDDIKVIRKTTLSGKVRDAITLEAVAAEIKIIDNKTNKVVSRAISNKKSGNYSISYAAGTHFRIEVIAKGYWEHVENLYIEQVISIQNINKDIMLTKEGVDRDEEKTFIIYNKKEDEFVENFKTGQQIPINYLNFKLKETRLDAKAKPGLDRLIDLLNKNKTVSIEVAGYSDDDGNARVENMMALRRAKEVEKYLTMHGLEANRISVKSYGNTRPLIPGKSEKARSKNRRVEIIVR